MPIKSFSQATDVGLMRENNEDAIFSNPKIGLWLVADGMGGHAAGEVASQIASETIGEAVADGASLVDSIQAAHKTILKAVDDGIGKYGMGSTVVAIKCSENHYQVAWVGDSRAYLYSTINAGSSKEGLLLKPLSTDHSYVQMLYQSGMISEEEMIHHPEKNIITQCLGSNEAEEIVVDVVDGVWNANELILLCSDGLSDIVSDSDICDILKRNSSDLDSAIKQLVEAALNKGGKDNISVVLVAAPLGLTSNENPQKSLGALGCFGHFIRRIKALFK